MSNIETNYVDGLELRIKELELDRYRWEAAFNSERKACLYLQTERNRLRGELQNIIDMEVPGRILVLSDAVDIAKQALKD